MACRKLLIPRFHKQPLGRFNPCVEYTERKISI